MAPQQYMPDELVGREYYHPNGRGYEREVGQRLDGIRRILHVLIINGVAMPEPTPWTTRAHRITGNECPTIMRHDPSTARMTAAMRACCRGAASS